MNRNKKSQNPWTKFYKKIYLKFNKKKANKKIKLKQINQISLKHSLFKISPFQNNLKIKKFQFKNQIIKL